MQTAAEHRKQAVRDTVRTQRSSLTATDLKAARAGFTKQLTDLVVARGAQAVSCYMPLGSEPDTGGFIEWLRINDGDALFPSSRDDGLLDWISPSWQGTVPGKFGILEPEGERLGPTALASVDLLLIPACAVDYTGMRLGWGRGYYDRALAAIPTSPPVFAVVYDSEIFDSVPTEVHDVPVTGAVTPTRTLVFNS